MLSFILINMDVPPRLSLTRPRGSVSGFFTVLVPRPLSNHSPPFCGMTGDETAFHIMGSPCPRRKQSMCQAFRIGCLLLIPSGYRHFQKRTPAHGPQRVTRFVGRVTNFVRVQGFWHFCRSIRRGRMSPAYEKTMGNHGRAGTEGRLSAMGFEAHTMPFETDGMDFEHHTMRLENLKISFRTILVPCDSRNVSRVPGHDLESTSAQKDTIGPGPLPAMKGCGPCDQGVVRYPGGHEAAPARTTVPWVRFSMKITQNSCNEGT